MCRIALPSILQQSTVSIGMMLVQSVVNSFGAQMLAGYSAGMRIESICIVPMAAMGNVMSSFTAQNLGAKQQERVVKGYHTAYGIVFGFGILICVILEIFYRPLILMFLGEEGTALALNTGMSYMRVYRFLFQFYRTENDHRRSFKRCGRYEDVYCGKSGEPGYPCGSGGDHGPQIRHCLCMVCGSYGMAGQLSYFFCQV